MCIRDSLKAVLEEVKKSEGKINLFIDELHLIVGAGKTDGAMDAGNMLKPMLARGEDVYKRQLEDFVQGMFGMTLEQFEEQAPVSYTHLILKVSVQIHLY